MEKMIRDILQLDSEADCVQELLTVARDIECIKVENYRLVDELGYLRGLVNKLTGVNIE
jgi:hypothetical protein